jgi:YbbR domain-containing protein
MSSALASARRFLKQAATERLGLKLTAFVITVLLLTLVRFQEESERFFDVEVVPLLPEPVSGLVMTSGFPKTVRVRLAGSSSVINSLAPSEIPPIEVDLTSRRIGTSHYYFNDEEFEDSLRKRSKKMQFVRVVRTLPESVQIRMERLVSRELPVRVNTAGKLAPGTELDGKPTVRPSEVHVVGPASAMQDLKEVETDDVLLDGLGVGDHVQIVAAIPQVGVSVRGGEELEVTVRVRFILGERVIAGLPVSVQGAELHAEAKPAEVSVTLSGPQIFLDELSPKKLKPVVTVDEEKASVPGVYPSDVALTWLPDEVKLTAIEPTSVVVALTHHPPPEKKQEKRENPRAGVKREKRKDR